MAKKRASIKDRNVFKKGAKADTQVDEATTQAGANASDTASEEPVPQSTATEPPAETISADAPPEAGMPIDESGLDPDSPDFNDEATEDDFDFPAAIELPADDDIDFPPAFEPALAGDTAYGIPDVSYGLPIADDDEYFPPAMELPPSYDASDFAFSLGSEEDLGDMDMAFPPAIEAPAIDNALPPDNIDVSFDTIPDDISDFVDDNLDFPPAVELPRNEAGIGVDDFNNDFDLVDPNLAPIDDLPPDDIDIADLPPDAGIPEDFETFDPDIPEDTPFPPAAMPPTDSTGSRSRTRPLTFEGEDADALFDFVGTADEAIDAEYQIPADFMTLSSDERQAILLKDKQIQKQLDRAHTTVDKEYERILNNNISSNKDITDWAHNLLAETRYILMNYQVEFLPKAEWNLQQVMARLDRAEESEKWRKKWAWPILGWGLVWFFVFVVLAFRPLPILAILESSEIRAMSEFLDPEIFLRTIFFGGIGGVSAVFYSLLKYVSARMYDKEYNVSYFVKPFMGMIVGAIVYLLIFGVARALNLIPSSIIGEAGDAGRVEIAALITYFVAVAAGFKENLAFRLLGRIMKIVLKDDQEDEDVPANSPPPSPYPSQS